MDSISSYDPNPALRRLENKNPSLPGDSCRSKELWNGSLSDSSPWGGTLGSVNFMSPGPPPASSSPSFPANSVTAEVPRPPVSPSIGFDGAEPHYTPLVLSDQPLKSITGQGSLPFPVTPTEGQLDVHALEGLERRSNLASPCSLGYSKQPKTSIGVHQGKLEIHEIPSPPARIPPLGTPDRHSPPITLL